TIGGNLNTLKSMIENLIEAISQKEMEFKGVVKTARTCLQDALPITFDQQFSGYRSAFQRHTEELLSLEKKCLGLPLGATAVGTGFGASKQYTSFVFEELNT